MNEPVMRDKHGNIAGLSTLRLHRLLKMAKQPSFHHKRFYSQYCFLQQIGYTGWMIGTAFLTEAGEARLRVEEEMS